MLMRYGRVHPSTPIEYGLCWCRGELPEDMAASYEKQRKGFESLQRLVASLADSLNRPLPHLPEATTRLAPEGGVSLVSKQVGCSKGCTCYSIVS